MIKYIKMKQKNKPKPTTFWQKVKEKAIFYLKVQIYYTISGFFLGFYKKISRSIEFAVFGYKNYDFDYLYLYDIMGFKLKRIEKCLKNGHAIHQKDDLLALKESIKICSRLADGNHDDKYHKVHDKKWGSTKSKFIPMYDDEGKKTGSRWETSRKNAKNSKQKSQEKKEFLKCYTLGERDRRKDIDRLAEILKKHSPKWWD